jgi:ABC-type nitrate/sulfonate/bicarbonate transport system substrate-binding protein
MKKTLYISLLTFCCLIISCTGSNKNDNGEVTIRQEWFPNANYAGEVLAAKEFDKQNNINLEVKAGSATLDPIKLVLSGKDDFGVVGAEKVLLANQAGANLVVIGVINYNSPTRFISRKKENITAPKDFEGKRIGVLTGTATEYIYKALIKKANVNTEKLNEVEVSFDLATFINGQYDVRPAFIYDEPVTLDIKNIDYNIINPADYGVSFIGPVYFTTQQMIDENPETVQKFINAVAKGWEEAISNPEKAIKALKSYDETIDYSRELKSLRKALPLFKGYNDKVLTADSTQWNGMVELMKNLELIESVNLNKSVNSSFVEEYHSSKNNNDE